MAACGGLSPFPMRMGGGKSRLEYLLEALNAGRGTAYDTSIDSPVYVENMAHARALYAAWLENERLGNMWVPAKMTSSLSRWEAILGYRPGPSESATARRVRVEKSFRRIGAIINRANVEALLREELGDVFVKVEYISPSIAVIHVPDATYPYGTVVPDVPWYSTVLHLLVLLQKPQGYSEGDFYERAGKVNVLLDGILPAWMTWDWYRPSECGPPVNVAGGPSMAGFYLDCPHNLDNNIFDI